MHMTNAYSSLISFSWLHIFYGAYFFPSLFPSASVHLGTDGVIPEDGRGAGGVVGVKNGYGGGSKVESVEDYVNCGSTRGYNNDTNSNNLPPLVKKLLSKIKSPHVPRGRS